MSPLQNTDVDLDSVTHRDPEEADHQDLSSGQDDDYEEEDSWVAKIRGGGDDNSPIDATDSNMKKASTPVGSQADGPTQHSSKEVETDADSMLQNLEAGTGRAVDDQQDQVDDAAPSRGRRRSSVSNYSTDAPEETDDYPSRRETDATDSTWDRHHDGRGGEEEGYGGGHETEDSVSRRESGASQGTYESNRRRSEYTYDEGTEGGEDSLAHREDDDAQGPYSRRESGAETGDDSLAYDKGMEGGEASLVSDEEDGTRALRSQKEKEAGHKSEARESLAQDHSIHDQSFADDHSTHEYMAEGDSIRESVEFETHDENEPDEDRTGPEEGGDSGSSHHDNEDNVFSDHSPRSSFGSLSNPDHNKRDMSVQLDDDAAMTQRSKSPRMSEISRYEDDEDQEEVFVSTVRGTPRPPFRSPSSVRAMQMSSPPPSVVGSSRPGKRQNAGSRLESPRSSTQYSPKRTPPRFKRNTPPLVLLHATLLPLRWPWGHVLDSFPEDELSDGAKSLRGAWRLLQDRMGDTVCERGILLPHPQNDFEVLEERIIEALELPLRKRARILECGHYLGPSNEMTLSEDEDSEDDEDQYRRGSATTRRNDDSGAHWCGTCQSEIRFDALGAAKVFRVKVYASNGLVKAGAWEACWKDMERVDVEVEPIVEPLLHEELVRLDTAVQQVDLDHAEVEHEHAIHQQPHEQPYFERGATPVPHASSVSPPPPDRMPTAEPGRRWADEQRIRDTYGSTPPISAAHRDSYRSTSEVPRAASTVPPASVSEDACHETPISPSAEAFARREDNSLTDLLVQTIRVMLADRKNVLIFLMSVLVLVLAVRGGRSSDSVQFPSSTTIFPAPFLQEPPRQYGKEEPPLTVTVTQMQQQQQQQTATAAASPSAFDVAPHDPCQTVGVTMVADEVVRAIEEPIAAQSALPAIEASAEEHGAAEGEEPVQSEVVEDAAESTLPSPEANREEEEEEEEEEREGLEEDVTPSETEEDIAEPTASSVEVTEDVEDVEGAEAAQPSVEPAMDITNHGEEEEERMPEFSIEPTTDEVEEVDEVMETEEGEL